MLCAEGKRAAEKKTKEQFQRPSVESTVEDFLEDVDFPPDPLKKRSMGETQVTGAVKFFVDITHNGTAQAQLPHPPDPPPLWFWDEPGRNTCSLPFMQNRGFARH